MIAPALAIPHEGRANVFTFSNPDAPLPATSGDGLIGDYYRPTNEFDAFSVANVNKYIAGKPTDRGRLQNGSPF